MLDRVRLGLSVVCHGSLRIGDVNRRAVRVICFRRAAGKAREW